MKSKIAMLTLIASVLGGCATSGVGEEVAKVGGDKLDQSASSVKSNVQGPATIASVRENNALRATEGNKVITDDMGYPVMEGDGTITVTGPNTNLLELSSGVVNQGGVGPSGHGAVVDLGDGQKITMYSATATKLSRKVVTKGEEKSEEFTIDSDPSEPTRAYGDAVLSPMLAYYQGLTQAQRDAFIEGVKVNSEQTKAIVDRLAGPDAWGFLRALVGA
jgi:predicted small secreted protein